MKRSTVITALVCVNALLLFALVLSTTRPTPAFAQDAAPALGTNYMFAAGEIQDQYDAVYMIDTRSRKLYAFAYDRGNKQLNLVDGRDLKRDFRNEGG